jgi:hypothetical protein
MSKKKHKTFRNKFKHSDLSTKLSKYDYMSCYSYNKRNNQTEFEDLTSLFNIGYPFDKDNIQSVDFIISGTTNGQFLVTGIVGRIDKNNMYDRDVFNIFPENPTGDTYSVIQSLHFKDENGQRLTDKYTSCNLTTDEDKIDELYQAFLTGTTNHYTIDDYSRDFEKFIKACHLTYKRQLNNH